MAPPPGRCRWNGLTLDEGEAAMKAMTWILSAVMLATVAGVAQANAVWIDYSGPRVVSNGLTQVTATRTGDSLTQIVRRGDRNTAKTGGTDTARYLALRISPAFKTGLKSRSEE